MLLGGRSVLVSVRPPGKGSCCPRGRCRGPPAGLEPPAGGPPPGRIDGPGFGYVLLVRSFLDDVHVCPKCRGAGVVFRVIGRLVPVRLLNRLPAAVEFATCPACGGRRHT